MRRLNQKHKALIDAIIDGQTLEQASVTAYPNHAKWTKRANQAFAKTIANSELGKAYKAERLQSIDAAKKAADVEKYRAPLISFNDIVNVLVCTIEYYKKETERAAELFDADETQTKILNATSVNGMLSAVDRLCKLYHFDALDLDALTRRRQTELDLIQLRAARERLEFERRAIMLDREKGEICYNDTAIAEFSNVIKGACAAFARLPATLSEDTRLTPEQKALIFESVEAILEDLSHLHVELSATIDVDKRLQSIKTHDSNQAKKTML